MELLKQSTATFFSVGPMVDTAGYTAITSLTVTNVSMIKVLKEGSAALTDIIANTFTHLANGVYRQQLTVADTNTIGKLEYHLGATTAAPQHREFMVIPANVYDSVVGGTDLLDINVDQINQVSTPANNLRLAAGGLVPLVVAAGSSSSVIETDLTEATNDHYNGRTLLFTSGALAGQAGEITDYNGATKELTVSTLTESPTNGAVAVII